MPLVAEANRAFATRKAITDFTIILVAWPSIEVSTDGTEMSETVPKGLVGTSVLNVDGPAIVIGRATYAVDLDLPGIVHGEIVCSAHLHARLVSMDVSAALAVEGVLLALTPDDIRGRRCRLWHEQDDGCRLGQC